MNRRRAQFAIGVVYETPTKKMEKIPKIIQKIVEKEDIATFDRIHFQNFGDFSLDYVLVYYIETRDFKIFLETNERVLLNIKRAFEKEGIEFAYPTKTIHFAKQEK
jgi:small-conductance mechanosensitive channel